jgi:spore maturation protein A
MLGGLAAVLMTASLIFAVFTGNTHSVATAAAESCGEAVKTILTISGSMALWGGIISVAEGCGITKWVGKIISPVVRRLFSDTDKNIKAQNAVVMNITANLFGIGNAATPLGITAAKELNKHSPAANRNLAMLTVLNTASIQLIPSTIATLRLSHGSVAPYEITLPIIAVSLLSAAVGCLAVSVLYPKGVGK